MAAKPQKGEKSVAVLNAIRQIVKQTRVGVREVSHKECNNLLKHTHGFTVSDPLFYLCRRQVEKERTIKCKDCPKTFDQNWKLAQHVRIAHPKPKVKVNPTPVANGEHPSLGLDQVQHRVKPAVKPAQGANIHLEELPDLIVQARSLVSRLGKEQAKQFLDVV